MKIAMRFKNHDEASSRSDKKFGQAAVGMTHKLKVMGSIPALSTLVSLIFLPKWQLAALDLKCDAAARTARTTRAAPRSKPTLLGGICLFAPPRRLFRLGALPAPTN